MFETVSVIQLVVVAFLIIWISSFIFLFSINNKNDENEKNIIKLIGGFSLLLVSVYANISYIYVLAVTISGLIIASEKFMSVLIALLSAKTDIWQYENFTKTIQDLSKHEVALKNEEEIEEIRNIDTSSLESTKVTSRLSKEVIKYAKILPEIEQKALAKYEQITGIKIKKQVKIGNLRLDGVGINKSSKKLYVFEVKVIPDSDRKTPDKVVAEKIALRLRSTIPNMLLSLDREIIKLKYSGYSHIYLSLIIVVDSDRDLKEIMDRVGSLKLAYNDSQQDITVRFQFYNSSSL